MIKIVKEGKKEFEGTCDLCGTIFTYELSDIVTYGDIRPYVKCPVCKWVKPCIEKQPYITGGNIQTPYDYIPTYDKYEKIPYWMRPDYKAPEVTCKRTTDLYSSDSSNFDYSTVSMLLDKDSL